MKLVEMKCKNCGSALNVDSEAKEVKCKYCQTIFKIDVEIQHHKLDDAEKIGYELEKGKIRAQEELKAKKIEQQNVIRQAKLEEEKRKKNLKWWIIGWILCFPIPLTILIWKNTKWDKKIKTIIIAVLWIIVIIIGALSNANESNEKKNMIIKCYSEETYNKLNDIIGIDNIKTNISNSTSCESLKLKDNNYKEIEVKVDEDKKLLYIKVDNEIKYGDDPSKEILDRDVNLNKKEDYEFLTMEGFTTLQSLLMNIGDNTRYNHIKNMADYVGYYVKDLSQGEHYGLIKLVYNCKEENYYSNSTETAEFIYDDYKGEKLRKIEYSTKRSLKYIYYINDKESNTLIIPNEKNKKITSFRDAFQIINEREGYEG